MTIPQKHFYTIGDVCSLTGTKPHVLRYWESKFKLLRPARRYSGHRKFTPEDIDLINRIRYLIVDRKFTLTGAKKEIQKQMGAKHAVRALSLSPETLAVLRDLQKDVDECLSLVKPARAVVAKQQELLQI
jgi:DNA-binding transcriptional MerR regulator